MFTATWTSEHIKYQIKRNLSVLCFLMLKKGEIQYAVIKFFHILRPTTFNQLEYHFSKYEIFIFFFFPLHVIGKESVVKSISHAKSN